MIKVFEYLMLQSGPKFYTLYIIVMSDNDNIIQKKDFSPEKRQIIPAGLGRAFSFKCYFSVVLYVLKCLNYIQIST